jgi:hypothetical protein
VVSDAHKRGTAVLFALALVATTFAFADLSFDRRNPIHSKLGHNG